MPIESNAIETMVITNDITVFGKEVTSFPNGIGDSFDHLIKSLPDGETRSYYGISFMKGDKMIYFAMAEEKFRGEAKQYSFREMVIKKGNYLATTLYDWMPKTHLIKNQFERLMKHPAANNETPAIEWYKNDNEMMCLLRKKLD
jgi:hypothetical protein